MKRAEKEMLLIVGLVWLASRATKSPAGGVSASATASKRTVDVPVPGIDTVPVTTP